MTIRAFLYSAEAPDRALELAGIRPAELTASQLLWVDIEDPASDDLRDVSEALDLSGELLRLEPAEGVRPTLSNFGNRFRLTATSVFFEDTRSPLMRANLTLLAGRNVVVSVHAAKIPFIDELRGRENGDTDIGALSAESIIASLLDWLLGSYFSAVEALVRDVDRVEVAILGQMPPAQFLDALVQARKRIAELRRLLKSHRDVFHGLARPDFMATERPEDKPHFEALLRHYERAEDELESARDLVIGSFELLSARAAQATNDTMRKLTFATVLMGVLALVAGVMGMNFDAPIFETGVAGFLVVIGFMLGLSVTAVWIGMRRSWI